MADSSAGWAQESSFASISATTGLPDASGLTPIFLDADSVVIESSLVEVERGDATRRSTAEATPRVGVGASTMQRRGRVIVTKEIECPGVDAAAAYAVDENIFGAAALDTLFLDEGAPTSATDAVGTAGTAKQWTPTTIGNGKNGDILGFALAGKSRTARITGRAGGDWKVGVAYPSAPALAAAGRFCRQWYAKTAWSSNSLYFEQHERGGQLKKAHGCKLTSFEIEPDETGRLMAVWTFEAAFVEIDNSSADIESITCVCNTNFVTPSAFDGGVRIASEYCGKSGTLATPANSDAIASFDGGMWKLSFNVALEPIMGVNTNNIGICGWRVGKPTVEFELPMCTASTALDNDRINNAKRQVIIDSGLGTEGYGFAIHLNGAVLKSDPEVFEEGEGEVSQRLVWQSGPYCSDTNDADAANGVNAWMTVGWLL